MDMDAEHIKFAQNAAIASDSDSDDSADDQVPDYRQLASLGGKGKESYIPRRGEKEFEPSGLRIQQKALDESRDAMFNAIDGDRQSSNKNMSIGLWSNAHSRASVVIQRGTHFSSLGHPIRNTPAKSTSNTIDKVAAETRLQLLPEETLYMVERGSLLCYEYDWSDNNDRMLKLSTDDTAVTQRFQSLPPFSAQRAFDCCIGKDGLTLSKYTVYAQLKRLGYIVKRAHNEQSTHVPSQTMWQSVSRVLRSTAVSALYPLSAIARLFTAIFTFRVSSLLGSRSCFLSPHQNYDSIFKALRLIPWGYDDTEELQQRLSEQEQHEFDVTWHVWRPSSNFKKTAPPPPDFRIVVVDAQKSSLPSIEQFAHMFSQQPYSSPPLTRKQRLAKERNEKDSNKNANQVVERGWLYKWWNRKHIEQEEFEKRKTPGVMFPALKFGKRNVVLAVVDSGTASWMQFGEGQFGEFPLY